MTALAVGVGRRTDVWSLRGRATIDKRSPVRCFLVISATGAWSAEVDTFTLAADVDLLFFADQGGEFCGPATVARSRADSDPIRACTELVGTGPMLIAESGDAELEAGPNADVFDGEVVE